MKVSIVPFVLKSVLAKILTSHVQISVSWAKKATFDDDESRTFS